jgi:hypothetical protein
MLENVWYLKHHMLFQRDDTEKAESQEEKQK